MKEGNKYSLRQLRRSFKSKLPESLKPFFRFSYNLIREPKSLNNHLNRLQYDRSLLRKSEIFFAPPIFIATITDDCNLRCPTCLYLLEDPDKFTPSYMRPDKLRQVLEKYNRERKAEVIFLSGGEPLLHPQFDEIVDICKEYNAPIKVSTNGILVKKKISCLAKLNYVNVSLDGYDYESYKKYRGGTERQFDLVIEGLTELKKARIHFSISYLLMSENLFAVERMIDLTEKINPDFVSFHNINPHGCQLYTPLTMQDRNTNEFLERILKRTDYPFDIDLPAIFDIKSPAFENAKCIQPWFYFCFNSAGYISYCCHLAHDRTIGNIFLDYNLNSAKMVKFRQEIMQGVILPSCRYCQRRFMDKEFGRFYAKNREWFINQ